jgi:hypothetical protein
MEPQKDHCSTLGSEQGLKMTLYLLPEAEQVANYSETSEPELAQKFK